MSPGKVAAIDFTTFYNIVDGKQVSSKNTHKSINPSTGKELWDCPIASREDLDNAVEASKKAFKSWSQTSIDKRKEMLAQLSDLYAPYEGEFIDLLMKENGKPASTTAIFIESNENLTGREEEICNQRGESS
jgi:acyl-CoA reductase-like NAD-dependent aldehyde dehydrogenase